MGDVAVAGPGAGERPLRVLVVTKLFPNAAEPTLATYNRLQLVALSRRCQLHLLAVIPWFPGVRVLRRWTGAGLAARVPAEEDVEGLRVLHPRVLYLPRIGAAVAPDLYVASLWPRLRHLRGQVDVVLGCWAFPDGVAAIRLGRLLGAASVVKVHGSDLNVLAERPQIRRILVRALPGVGRLVAVSRPLAERAVALGVPASRVAVVRNGLDRSLFHVRDRAAARAELGLASPGRWILYVGRLDRAKGIGELLAAFDRLAPLDPELRLALVGDGPDAGLGLAAAGRHPGRVALPGALPAAAVARWMGACDLLALPSWNEGTPNVILEAFASGRRVVATRVGGIPDVVTSPALGDLVPARDVPALAEALAGSLRRENDVPALVAAAPQGWPESAERLLEELRAAADSRADAARP